MKKLLFCALIGFVFVFSSCNKETEDLITTSCDTLKVTALPVNQSFTIRANSSWNVVSSDEWCTLSDSLGTGSKSLEVSFSNNLTGLAREAHLVIQTASQTKTIIVKQDGGAVVIDEEFDNNYNNWVFQSDSITNDIRDGSFHIKSKAFLISYFVGMKTLLTNYAGNYMIASSFKFISGSPFGLAFACKDNKNYYRLLVYPSWGCVITQVSNGVAKNILSVETSYAKSENAIKIVKLGDNGSLFLDGHQIGIFDFSKPSGVYVGFFSCPQTEVLVDNFKINKL